RWVDGDRPRAVGAPAPALDASGRSSGPSEVEPVDDRVATPAGDQGDLVRRARGKRHERALRGHDIDVSVAGSVGKQTQAPAAELATCVRITRAVEEQHDGDRASSGVGP